MSVEGLLRIALTLDGDRIRDVAITSTRPVQASRIFHGRETATVSMLMPRLFSVCGVAQSCAAAHALAAARGETLPSADGRAHRLLLLMETAQEHAWRLCMDGTRLMGEPPRFPAAAAARGLLGRLQRTLFPVNGTAATGFAAEAVVPLIAELETLLEQELFGAAPEAWCAAMAEGRSGNGALAARLLRFLERQELMGLGNVTPAFLTPLRAEMLDPLLAADDAERFIARPSLDGSPRESTPLARQWSDPALAPARALHGAGLGPRFTALLVELARLPQQMRAVLAGDEEPFSVAAASPAPGTGIAQVPAARGLLVHRVQLDGDTVLRYQILAPTEWNFHPDGVVARALTGCRVADTTAAQNASELIVQAIDPCVGFEVTLHA